MNRTRTKQYLAMIIALGFVLSSRPISAQNLVRKVNLEWEAVEDASLYEIRITRKLKGGLEKKAAYFKVKKSLWAAEVRPGLYQMEIRSYDERGVPGDWSEPTDLWVRIPSPDGLVPKMAAKILSKEVREDQLEFSWSPVNGAEKYLFEIENESGDFKKTETIPSTNFKLRLPVAQKYKWKVTSIMPEGEPGDPPEDFTNFSYIGAPIEDPKLIAPLSSIVQELTWEPAAFAESYQYALQFNSQGQWKTIEKKTNVQETKIPFDLARPSGNYRLQVRASGPLRQNSKVANLDFDVKGGLRDPAAIENAVLKESLEKPTKYYAIASYFLSQISYLGPTPEGSSKFSTVGGTGRLGLGYQALNSPWGAFGILDMSGFTLQGQNFTFGSIELHGTWMSDSYGRGKTTLGAGIFVKSLPELQGNPTTGFTGVKEASTTGLHAGGSYWIPLSATIGFSANARAYLGLDGEGPRQEKVEPSLSLQYGILGSYKFSRTLMGYAGYAYRADQIVFKTRAEDFPFAPAGGNATIKVDGHYLNMILEYSF